MNIVLFHLGNKLPDYFTYCTDQIKLTNPDSVIYLLTNSNIDSIPNVKVVDVREFEVPDISNYFSSDIHHKQLWQTSLIRIFYLEAFLRTYNIKDIIHFDNDVLIYHNYTEMLNKFKKFNFLITPQFDTEYVFGFSYIKDYKSLTPITSILQNLISLPFRELQTLTNTEYPHEMRLLSYVNKISNNKYIDLLPVVVDGEGSDNFNIFNMVFDPSSYGKHIAGSHCLGSHNRHFVTTPKWNGTETHHYIGKQIHAGIIEVDLAGNIPYIIYNETTYKISNLHIHNKQLKDFIIL